MTDTSLVNTGFVKTMARYNEWMNSNLLAKAAGLPEQDYTADQGAFFGSIHGTFNHIMVADILWLRRFAKHAPYRSLVDLDDDIKVLSHELYRTLAELKERRERLDRMIIAWSEEVSDAELHRNLRYTDTKGREYVTPMAVNVMHMFNHATHHRGQITTLFSQMKIDVGVTDLAVYYRENFL